jgi:hypothetical protein
MAHAQDDGARAYQVAPAGTRAFIVWGVITRGNKSLDPGSVVEGAEVDVNVSILQYAHPLVLGTRLRNEFRARRPAVRMGTEPRRSGGRHR